MRTPPSGACTDKSLGTVGSRVGVPQPPPRPPALGVGQAQMWSRGTTVARARLGTHGGGARAPAPRGGVSRVRPARERACGCAYPAADWPARVVRVRARCQARTVGSRSAWCLRGSCAQAADVLDWPAGNGGGAALLGNCGWQAGGPGSVAPPRPHPCPSQPAPRWSPEWALSRPAGAPAPLCLFFGGNQHNDRKENLSLRATKISRLDWASTQSAFQGRKKTKNCPLSPSNPLRFCLSKFCLY